MVAFVGYASSVTEYSKSSRYRVSAEHPRDIRDIERRITGGGSPFGQLLNHAKKLSKLDTLIRSCLESDIATHCQVAALRDNRLILLSPSAAWATRLRMQAPQLRRFLHQSGFDEFERIEVRVAPLSKNVPLPRRRKSLSPAAQSTFEQYAQTSLKTSENRSERVKTKDPDVES